MLTVPVSYLRECLSYDKDTGVLTWKSRPLSHFPNELSAKIVNGRRAGKAAGSVVNNGYMMLPLTFKGERHFFYLHRLAWAIHYGVFPESEIDHANGIRTDNRLSNLREATRLQNAANSVFQKQNSRGVRRHRNKWVAQMSFLSEHIYLGIYDTEKEAHAAFCGAVAVTRDPRFAQLTHVRK